MLYGFELEYDGKRPLKLDDVILRSYHDSTYSTCFEACSKPASTVEKFIDYFAYIINKLHEENVLRISDNKFPRETGLHISLSDGSNFNRLSTYSQTINHIVGVWNYSLETLYFNRNPYHRGAVCIKPGEIHSRMEFKWGKSTFNPFAALKYLTVYNALFQTGKKYAKDNRGPCWCDFEFSEEPELDCKYQDNISEITKDFNKKVKFLSENIKNQRKYIEQCLEVIGDDKSSVSKILQVSRSIARKNNPLYVSRKWQQSMLTETLPNKLDKKCYELLRSDTNFKRRFEGRKLIAVRNVPRNRASYPASILCQ